MSNGSEVPLEVVQSQPIDSWVSVSGPVFGALKILLLAHKSLHAVSLIIVVTDREHPWYNRERHEAIICKHWLTLQQKMLSPLQTGTPAFFQNSRTSIVPLGQNQTYKCSFSGASTARMPCKCSITVQQQHYCPRGKYTQACASYLLPCSYRGQSADTHCMHCFEENKLDNDIILKCLLAIHPLCRRRILPYARQRSFRMFASAAADT